MIADLTLLSFDVKFIRDIKPGKCFRNSVIKMCNIKRNMVFELNKKCHSKNEGGGG